MGDRLTRLLVFLFATILLPGGSQAASEESTPPGLTSGEIKSIIDAASGDRALHDIHQLSLHHRWFVSDGYFEAAAYVRDRAEKAGLEDVRIDRFPSDGRIAYSTDKTLPKWSVQSATLRMVAPVSKGLASWEENPIVLASNSRSADVEAELVDVGEGVQASDYEGKDVRGKIVLASSPQEKGRIEVVHRLAVLERGAAGVVSYRSYHLDDFPDLITWDHIWTLGLNGTPSTFGFCISKRMGWELKRLLDGGERVVLHAKVEAELSPGEYGVVTGHIPGTDLSHQEIWFVAHLDHSRPSANDNASGSAAILEAARTLKALYGSGALPAPRRTLRFFWVPEINGSYAYISRHLEETKRAVAVINMDMVGENQELCGSVFRVTETPDSTASFLNDLLRMNLDFLLAHDVQPGREVTDPYAVVSPLGTRDTWKAMVTPYSGGSDHVVFMGGVVNIPATMLGSWPDDFYHSSGDTPDKADPTQLRRTVVYGVMLASSIASMNADEGLDLLERMFAASRVRMERAMESARSNLEGGELTGEDLKEALNVVRWAHRREAQSLRSLASLIPGEPSLAARVEELTVELGGLQKTTEETVNELYRDLCQRRGQKVLSVPAPSREEQEAAKRIPVRSPSFPGPISSDYVASKLKEMGRVFEAPFTAMQLYELGAFMNGELSLLEIRDAVSAEYGPVRLSDVTGYMRVLADIGLVVFKE